MTPDRNEIEATTDRSDAGDMLCLAVLFLVPCLPFVLTWSTPTALPDLFSPLMGRDDVLSMVPKLNRDFDAIAARHFDYAPEPYVYAYFFALVAATVGGIAFIPRNALVLRRPARKAAIKGRIPNTYRGAIALLAGVAMFLFWPWFGLSLMGAGDVSIPPGIFHDVLMILLLFMYGQAIAAGPVYAALWFSR